MNIRIPNLSPKALGSLCLAAIIGILLAGLWPFNFWPANEVSWLKDRNGVHFYGRGIIFSPEPTSKISPPIFRGGPVTIELWLRSDIEPDSYVPRILSFYDGRETEGLLIGQWKSSLILRVKENRRGKRPYREISVENTLPKGQSRFVTVASDEKGTRIYVDGRVKKKFSHFSFMIEGSTDSPRLILGNSPLGGDSWEGYFYGLAIYPRSLTGEEIFQNYQDWTDGKAPFTLKSPAQPMHTSSTSYYFPFHERTGNQIHDQNNRHALLMPSRFIPPQKDFLIPPWKDFSFSFSYLSDVIVNILGFIPLGFLIFGYLCARGDTALGRSMILVIFLGSFLSLAIEIIQVYLPGRSSQLMDLLTNILGTTLGAIGFYLYSRRRMSEPGNSSPV